MARHRGARRALRGHRRAAVIAVVLAIAITLLPGLAQAQDITHPNGLVLPQPHGASARQTTDGFTIADADAARRRAVSALAVRLLPAAPAGKDDAVARVINGRTVHYRVVQAGGGSGGEEHDLTAWFAARGGIIVVAATRQAEWPARPDFGPAWRFIADLIARNP